MQFLGFTGFYSALLGILFIGLAINIIKLRLKHRVGIGDGDNEALAKAIRVHGNFAEYVPLALILFACYELSGASEVMLHLLGGLLVVGRILHVIGLSKSIGTSKQRQIGMLSTFFVILALSVENIRLFVF